MSLGEKRNASIFSSQQEKKTIETKPAEQAPAIAKVIAEPIKESAKSHERKELAMDNRTHTLFFQTTEKQDFSTVLKGVQEHISNNYSELITSSDIEDSKEQMKRYIGKYIFDKKVSVDGNVINLREYRLF